MRYKGQSIGNYIYYIKRGISIRICSCFCYIQAYINDVHIGIGNKFIGITKFRSCSRYAHIYIGNNNRFNSSFDSNLIGVKNPCMISLFKDNARVIIGDGCGFSGVVIASALSIKIGDNVKVGANTLITDSDWHPEDPRSGKDKEIVIGNNVWIGYGCVILKGVHIGDNALIGANSVVTSDIPANVIAAGNPCKTIKEIKK